MAGQTWLLSLRCVYIISSEFEERLTVQHVFFI